MKIRPTICDDDNNMMGQSWQQSSYDTCKKKININYQPVEIGSIITKEFNYRKERGIYNILLVYINTSILTGRQEKSLTLVDHPVRNNAMHAIQFQRFWY